MSKSDLELLDEEFSKYVDIIENTLVPILLDPDDKLTADQLYSRAARALIFELGSKVKMGFLDYQIMARGTAIYPKRGKNLTYPILGLNGEIGELAQELKKSIRDDAGFINDQRRQRMLSELGDVLWYVSQVASELNANFEDVALANIKKLADRKKRNVLSGDGDDR